MKAVKERYRYFACHLDHRLADAMLGLVVLGGVTSLLVWLTAGI